MDHSRQTGFSEPQPILIGELVALLSVGGIASPTEKTKYLRLVQKLDRTYLSLKAEERDKKVAK